MACMPAEDTVDPYLWLEDVTGQQPLDWVKTHNSATVAEFAGDEFDTMRAAALEVLDTDARIPYVRRRGGYLYNFWRDATNPRGLWRRTTLESYRGDQPQWDVVIDLDELARADDENWVWGGANVIEPDHTRALISLSRGGSDAVVVREFDMTTKQFAGPEVSGFELDEAKTRIAWEDHDTVLVGTDFGAGSLTESGYPRIVKRWRRGQDLEQAETVFTGSVTDVVVAAGRDRTPGFERTLVSRAIDFFNDQVYELRHGELILIDAPTDSSVSVHRQWLLIELRTDWDTGTASYRAGSLLAADYDQFLSGTAQCSIIFEPDDHSALHQYAWTRDRLVLVTLHDVASRVEVITPPSCDDPSQPISPRSRSSQSGWQRRPISEVPENTNTVIAAADDTGDEIFLDSSGFDQPSRLLHGPVDGELTEIKSAPAFFDAQGLEVSQYFATSQDGTAIPYFVVRPPGANGPTLIGGYGGFEVSRTPGYDGVLGRLWLARGGTYVLANIRGGGEYGPRWHTQAMRAGRHLVAEDFAAVAADVTNRGISEVAQLGAIGGSNGGLLMGIMLTAYPHLFGALVCQVPLLDMRRYHLLLAGASWMAEYGDPDNPEDWAFIGRYSPYHNIAPTNSYPPVLITTSTRDDRVHPGHARKMTAALQHTGHRVFYYENIEGGHGGAADNAQAAFKSALSFAFLWQMLGGRD